MIAGLRGTITSIQVDRAVIEVNGVSYWFFAPIGTLSSLKEQETAYVHTQMVVREDSITLYGFTESSESICFEKLIGVSGIGPKLALAALSVFTASQLANILSTGDIAALTRIPGVGKKSAQRLVVEIGDKLGPGTDIKPGGKPVFGGGEEVVQALEQLGWKQATATAAVKQALEEYGEAPVEQLLRAALQILGRKHG